MTASDGRILDAFLRLCDRRGFHLSAEDGHLRVSWDDAPPDEAMLVHLRRYRGAILETLAERSPAGFILRSLAAGPADLVGLNAEAHRRGVDQRELPMVLRRLERAGRVVQRGRMWGMP